MVGIFGNTQEITKHSRIYKLQHKKKLTPTVGCAAKPSSNTFIIQAQIGIAEEKKSHMESATGSMLQCAAAVQIGNREKLRLKKKI